MSFNLFTRSGKKKLQMKQSPVSHLKSEMIPEILQSLNNKSQKNEGSSKKMNINSQNFVICKVGSFDNDYKIVSKIGEGSFGSVYKVYHKTLQVFRALKTIKKNPAAKFSVFAEIQILKKLDHINILKIYEFYEAKQSYYIVTQYFEGKQLFDEILQNDKISEQIAVQLINQILRAINYIHKQGIAHRDIKAQNILLKKNQNGMYKVKIIDWGLGALLNQQQQKNRMCGTPQYCAPQVLVGNYSISCDMWSLGVLAYIMLTGDMPFSGKNTMQTIQQVKKGQIDIKDHKFRKLSNQSQNFICSLIVKNPNNRLTAQQCLNHQWIKNNLQSRIEKAPLHLKQTLQRLRNFKVTNSFGLAVVSYVNNHLTSEQQKEKLSEIFRFLDKNGDGILSTSQLIQGYSEIYGKVMAQKIAQQTFQKIDINNNGSLQFSQFVAFGLFRQQQAEKQKLQQAFNLFDKNKDGKISVKQIQSIIVGKFQDSGITEDDIKQIIAQIDQNGDFQIDFQEFVKCVKQIYTKVQKKTNKKKKISKKLK